MIKKCVMSSALVIFMLDSYPVLAQGDNEVLQVYASQGVTKYDAEHGRTLWQEKNKGDAPYQSRSCESCHGQNLKQHGRHIKTNKKINPIAPSANTRSLKSIKKVKKWFKRNCKWTKGRECSAQEQADILAYLLTQ